MIHPFTSSYSLFTFFPFTPLHQLFVPFLIRERITNTCSDSSFIIYSISSPFVPPEPSNEYRSSAPINQSRSASVLF
jgi:hypothetical protein